MYKNSKYSIYSRHPVLLPAAIDAPVFFARTNSSLFANDTTNAAKLHDAVQQLRSADVDYALQDIKAPGISDRESVKQPLQTGIVPVDFIGDGAARSALPFPSWFQLDFGGDARANKELADAKETLADMHSVAMEVHNEFLTAHYRNLDMLATLSSIQYGCLFVAVVSLCCMFNLWWHGGLSTLPARVKTVKAGLWVWLCQVVSAFGVDIGHRKPSPELLAQVTAEVERVRSAVLADQAALAAALQRSAELSTIIEWWALLLVALTVITGFLAKRTVELGCVPPWVTALWATRSWRKLSLENRSEAKWAAISFVASTLLVIIALA